MRPFLGRSALRSTTMVVLTFLLMFAATGSTRAADVAPVAEKPAGDPLNISLVRGGTYVAYGGPTQAVAAALGDTAAAVTVIWYFDSAADHWLAWGPGLPGNSVGLQQLRHGEPYFIVAAEAVLWSFPGGGAIGQRTISLAPGANPIGYLEPLMSIADGVGSARSVIAAVWHWNAQAQSWEVWSPALSSVLQAFHDFVPGEVYWIQATGVGSFRTGTNSEPAAVTFTAGGDIGAREATATTFASIANSGAAFHLALGDLSYSQLSEPAWCDFVASIVGPDLPVPLVVGNHEDDDRDDGFIGNFTACLPDRMNSTGVYGAEYYFDVSGLLRVIMIGAGNDVDGEKYDYDAGSQHYAWLQGAITDARTGGIPWVIVGMHKNCISVGEKGCSISPDLMDLLLDSRVDLILQAHDHTYQRSAQLRCATAGTFRSECVVDSGADNTYTRGEGSVIVISGAMGGRALYTTDDNDPDAGYFAAWMGRDHALAGAGYAEVHVSASEMRVAFVGTTTTYRDAFTVR